MSIVIHIPPGFMGHCHCGKPAKHEEWMEFEKPIPPSPDGQGGMFPEVRGCFHFVCDDHKRRVQ